MHAKRSRMLPYALTLLLSLALASAGVAADVNASDNSKVRAYGSMWLRFACIVPSFVVCSG